MHVLVLAVFVPLACIAGWVYGEAANNRPVRLIATISCVVAFATIAAGVSGLHASLSIGVPLSSAFHEYLDAASDQLKAGHTDFVVGEFSEFKEHSPITYETGALLRNIESLTKTMASGPSQQ